MLGDERSELARHGGGRSDRRLRARGMDGLDPRRDQVFTDRLLIRLSEDVMDLGVRCRRDALEDGGRVVEPRLDAFEVEHRETAESCQLPGHPRIDHRVHR